MILRQTFEKPISGYWDGGTKKVFDWSIKGSVMQDARGRYVKVGSLNANHWFCVTVRKSDKATLANAKRRLQASAAKNIRYNPCKFEYVMEVDDV